MMPMLSIEILLGPRCVVILELNLFPFPLDDIAKFRQAAQTSNSHGVRELFSGGVISSPL